MGRGIFVEDVTFSRFIQLFIYDIQVGLRFFFVLLCNGDNKLFHGFPEVGLDIKVMHVSRVILA
jgi:hypothetical protein